MPSGDTVNLPDISVRPFTLISISMDNFPRAEGSVPDSYSQEYFHPRQLSFKEVAETHQGTLGYSGLSSLSHCGLIVVERVKLVRAS